MLKFVRWNFTLKMWIKPTLFSRRELFLWREVGEKIYTWKISRLHFRNSTFYEIAFNFLFTIQSSSQAYFSDKACRTCKKWWNIRNTSRIVRDITCQTWRTDFLPFQAWTRLKQRFRELWQKCRNFHLFFIWLRAPFDRDVQQMTRKI